MRAPHPQGERRKGLPPHGRPLTKLLNPRLGSTALSQVCLVRMRNEMLRGREAWQLLRAYACPTCSKSVGDLSSLWEHIDREVAMTPMPEEYRDTKVEVR